MGTALLVMVAGLPKTRTNTDEARAALDGVRAELLPLRVSLEVCADRDAEAFDAVMAAYRLPKATDEDKASRKTAIARAMQGATEVPLQTLRLACRALALGETVAQHGNVSAASDVGVAASLLYAASEGAAANVRINLGAWSEEKFRTETAAEADALVSPGCRNPGPHPHRSGGVNGEREPEGSTVRPPRAPCRAGGCPRAGAR